MQRYFSLCLSYSLCVNNSIPSKTFVRTSILMSNTKNKNHERLKRAAEVNPITWPSKNHCVVCFLHPHTNSLDVSKLTNDMGTMKDHRVMPKDNKTAITKVEMSNSNEAKKLWRRFMRDPPAGVIKVLPEQKYKTLSKSETFNQSKKNSNKAFFSEYWSSDLIEEKIITGEVIKGSLRINAKKYFHAFIADEDGRDILINGLKDRNRALNGDIVAVKINDKSEWIIGSENDKDVEITNVDNVVDKIEHLQIDKSNPNNEKIMPSFKYTRKTGKVVGLLEKKHTRSSVGHLKVNGVKGLSNDLILFSPISSTFPRLILPRSTIKQELAKTDLDKILFIGKIKEWSINHNIPLGELGEVIGTKGEVEAETKRILVDHDIAHEEFSEEVCNSFPHSFVITDEERAKRKDYSKECVFSIDPSTAKDLDDALHCREISPGIYEIGVHIADVSHFVKPDVAVDQVASQRCTSVYLVQKVIPMLPHILCEELCSLNPASEKLAFSVVWTMTDQGKILSECFGKSIIQSCAKLSYDHAQRFIDNPDKDFAATEFVEDFPEISKPFTLNDVKEKVLILHKISQNLRKKRFDNGALQLDQVKLSYTLSDLGLPTGCYASERKPSNELIEEFMLLANFSVAHKLYSGLPQHAFLRCHPEPKENMMEDFISHSRSIGLEIDSSSSGALAQSMNQCCGNDELAIFRKQALFMFAIKPQQLALYFCAGIQKDEKKFHHYALNVPLYTHFTSPIRRYADIVVHRQLSKVLGIAEKDEAQLQDPELLKKQAQLCNLRKYNSKIAQDSSVELFLNLLINTYGPFESNAMIMYVNDKSVDVLSMDYGVVKRIYINNLPGVMYKFEQKMSSEKHRVNSLVLKWTNQKNEINEDGSLEALPYDDSVEGILQTLEIFTIVKITLQKQEPESVLSVRALLNKPE